LPDNLFPWSLKIRARLVYVEGKLQTDQYEKNGETRYSTKIVVNGIGGNIQFLDKKENNASSLPKKAFFH
jgi:single-stranded DNA-binding protein